MHAPASGAFFFVKIKLTSIYASPHATAHPGSVIDVSEEEGKELVAGRFGIAIETAAAAPVAPETPADDAETADASAPETAAKRTGGKGSRSRSGAAAPIAPETE